MFLQVPIVLLPLSLSQDVVRNDFLIAICLEAKAQPDDLVIPTRRIMVHSKRHSMKMKFLLSEVQISPVWGSFLLASRNCWLRAADCVIREKVGSAMAASKSGSQQRHSIIWVHVYWLRGQWVSLGLIKGFTFHWCHIRYKPIGYFQPPENINVDSINLFWNQKIKITYLHPYSWYPSRWR